MGLFFVYILKSSVCLAVFYLGLNLVLFPLGAGVDAALETLGQALLVAFPLWLGGLGLFHMLLFVMRGSTAASIVYVVLVAVLGGGTLDLFVLFMPKLEPVVRVVRVCLLTTPFDRLIAGNTDGLIAYAWVLGLAWLVGSTVVGLLTFRKREIS